MRPANVPGGSLADRFGVDHEWISTNTGLSFGMGDGAGVPKSDPPFVHTYVVDHTGETPTRTITYRDVDQAALMSYLKRGSATGRWVLGLNDCNTWAEGAIRESRPHDLYSRAIVTRNGVVGGAPHLLYRHVVVYADGSIHQR